MSIPYPDFSALPPELQEVVEKRPINVFRMLMHTPNIAPGYLSMAEGIMKKSPLPRAIIELMILRVGHRYHAPYELFHHERLARAAGLPEAAVAGAATGAGAEGLSSDERAIVRWTDLLLDDHELVGEERDAAIHRFGLNGLADIVMTVGFYQLVCNFLRTFEIAIENPLPA